MADKRRYRTLMAAVSMTRGHDGGGVGTFHRRLRLFQTFTGFLAVQLDSFDFAAGCDECSHLGRKRARAACGWLSQSEVLHDRIELALHPELLGRRAREVGLGSACEYHDDRRDGQKIAQAQSDIHGSSSFRG